jgi:hypothetical protein
MRSSSIARKPAMGTGDQFGRDTFANALVRGADGERRHAAILKPAEETRPQR